MCAGIHHPTRGGTRGGKDQFDWEDVKTDKDRECYLGQFTLSTTNTHILIHCILPTHRPLLDGSCGKMAERAGPHMVCVC